MPQLQINQGPQDALLYDNTRSYFTNVGYVRTSNFQVEYRDVDAQNSAQLGSTVQYVIPKAADLLGPVDLRVEINPPATGAGISGTAAANDLAFSQFVDELGFAMIEKVTFSVGSNDIETITGEQMQIKNELMTSDEQRLGFDHVLKTGRRAFQKNAPDHGDITSNDPSRPGDNSILPAAYAKDFNKDYTRLISYNGESDLACAGPSIAVTVSHGSSNSNIVGSGLTAKGITVGRRVKFTSKQADPNNALPTNALYYVKAVTGTGGTAFTVSSTPTSAAVTFSASHVDGDLSVQLLGEVPMHAGKRSLIIPLNLFFTKHVSQYFPLAAVAGCNDIRISIKFRSLNELVQVHTIGAANSINIATIWSNGAAIKASETKLRCHYVHVTGPEATTLMNKEHVRLLKLWQHFPKTFSAVGDSFEMDLSFLHPVTTLIVTIRRQGDLNSITDNTNKDAAQKGYFFYHGDGTAPNYDAARSCDTGLVVGDSTDTVKDGSATRTLKVKSMQLTLNGQERHPGLDKGIDTEYLQHRLLPMLHSNSNQFDKQMAALYSGTVVNAGDLQASQRYELKGSKNIFVYPFSLNPEGSNPSGAVNFSKVSHAKLKIFTDGVAGGGGDDFRVDVYGLYYNWLQIKDGRALLSFA